MKLPMVIVAALGACTPAPTSPGPDPYLARQLECVDAGRVGDWTKEQIDACRANVRASMGAGDREGGAP
jgi:hypothetical protein